ncbi:MAG: cytidylate kinase-like family protein [Gemmataceae bacterium]|nr:cytidylate kinase-like family protein [Gemmataceae bacterium]
MDRMRALERLRDVLAENFRHWQAAEESSGAPRPAFTIALSREAGAGGREVARELGARLGWPVYDRELLELIAKEMEVPASLLERVDEKHKGWLEELFEAISSTPAVGPDVYASRLGKVLLSLAARGDCVILGRAAAQILPAATTLRVRLVAPREARIVRAERRLGVGREQAVRWVETTDRERDRFVRDHFRKDPADPHLYDLVLNTARFPPAECAELIARALERIRAEAPVPATA